MQLTSLQADHFRIPLPVTLSDSTHGEMTHFELVTVRLRDGEGAEGLGYTYSVGAGGAAIHALIARDLAPLLEIQIQRDGFFTLVIELVTGSETKLVQRFVDAFGAHLIGHIGRLDLDDLGPHHGQLKGGEWSRVNMGEIQHPNAVKCTHRVSGSAAQRKATGFCLAA